MSDTSLLESKTMDSVVESLMKRNQILQQSLAEQQKLSTTLMNTCQKQTDLITKLYENQISKKPITKPNDLSKDIPKDRDIELKTICQVIDIVEFYVDMIENEDDDTGPTKYSPIYVILRINGDATELIEYLMIEKNDDNSSDWTYECNNQYYVCQGSSGTKSYSICLTLDVFKKTIHSYINSNKYLIESCMIGEYLAQHVASIRVLPFEIRVRFASLDNIIIEAIINSYEGCKCIDNDILTCSMSTFSLLTDNTTIKCVNTK